MKKKTIIILAVILSLVLLLGILLLVQKKLDELHEQERQSFKIQPLSLSVDQEVTAPGAEVHLTADASGGKGTLFYEFYYLDGEEKVVIQEKSEQNSVSFTSQGLALYNMYVDVSDESPWTDDQTASCRYGAAQNGVDVSAYQGEVDWAALKEQGITFAMLRTGFGHENPEDQQDARFAENIQNAHAAGIKVGAYHFSYALTPEDAAKEAEFCLSILEPYKDMIDFPIAFDIEGEEHKSLSEEELIAVINAFCEPVAAAGYTPIVYTYDSWLIYHPGWKQLKDYDLWIANWSTSPQSEYDYVLWQHTNTGRLDGVGTNVDLNYAFCDYEDGEKILVK